MKSTLTLAVFAAMFATIASAQDASMQGHDMSGMELPAACQTSSEAPPMEGMESMMEGLGEAQQAMMQGMMAMHEPMMKGVMAEDPDIAFACGMIPHHRGAIAMAEAELQYGDSQEMKEMAQKIIDAQKEEIATLTQWIEEQSQ